MSTFNLSDITLAGAYAQALKSAQDSDKHDAARYPGTGESHKIRKDPWTLVKRLAASVAEKRLASSPLHSRPH